VFAMERSRRIRIGFTVLLFAVLFLAPQLGGTDSYRMGEYELVLSLIVVAIALNLAMGYAGQNLLGITAVFACSAYGAVLFAEHQPAHTGLAVMCLVGVVIGAVSGLIIGLPALRIGGFYLAVVSLYAAIAVPLVTAQWSYAGGQTGVPLYAVEKFTPHLVGEGLYLVLAGFVVIVSGVCWAIVHSRIGHRFAVLEASRQLAGSLGVSGYRTKLLTILTSSVLAGVGGGMYVYSQQFFAPGSTSTNLAILVVASVVIGGMGTAAGPIVGGIIVFGINEFFTSFQEYNGFVFGGLLLGCAIFLPNGVIGRLRSLEIKYFAKSDFSTGVTGTDTPRTPRSADSAAGHTDGRILEVTGARRSFGGIVAVDDVDVVVHSGSIHGLIGSNGSGKTTLLNLISAFYRLDAGRVSVNGVVMDMKPSAIALGGVARTFQTPKLIWKATLLENVVPAAELRTHCTDAESVLRLPRGLRSDRETRECAMDALAKVGLGHLSKRSADSLPHGTRRLTEVARAIAMEPDFILLDEPAAGLSARELDVLIEVVVGLAESGMGILLVEHNVPVVLDIARDVTVLHQGRRIFHGTPQELVANTEVADAFLGVDVDGDGPRHE
jgi:branched-chain amino acid transport system ATP-binding protein/branched-chain amino acid transport system permease protein